MTRRRILVLCVLAIVAAAAATIGHVAARDDVACACDVTLNLTPVAEQVALRFEDLVRADDVPGAWALLTDGARARYGDATGFRPVVARLRAGYQEGGWLGVAEEFNSSTPSEVVLARYAGPPPRLVSSMVVHVWFGRTGDERVDPEPAALDLRAGAGAANEVRIDTPGADLDRAWFVAVDATGAPSHPSQSFPSAGGYRLSWPAATPGPVLVIGAASSVAGWRVGAVAAAIDGG